MANQMIALGVRGPQLPNLGAAAAQMSNVMANMATAREKQASTERARAFRQLVSSPEFDPMNPEDIKAAQALDPAGAEKLVSAGTARRKADLEIIGEQTKQFRDVLAIIDPADPQTYAQFQSEVTAAIPGWARFLPAPEQWNADTKTRLLMKADDVINKTIPTPTATYQMDEKGDAFEARVGGLGPKGVFPLDEYTKAPTGGQGGPMEMAPQGRQTLGRDIARILATVPNEEEYQAALSIVERADPTIARQIRAIAPRFDPQALQQIVNSAEEAFGAQMTQRPGGLVTGDRGGMGGPDEMVDGFVSTGRQFRGKSPMQSPLPGSAAVPLGRVAAEARAGRETAKEVYDKELAREKARLDAAAKAPPKRLTPVQEAKLRDNIAKDYKSARSTIEMMDGVTRAVNDVRNLSRDQKEAITGFSGYAPSILPSSRSADTKLKNLQGKVTEMGKAAASLTGAIGQMAVQEWRIVSDMIASLDVTGMEPGDLDNQLDIIEGQAKRAASITRDAYENQYVEDFARYPGRFQLPSGKAPAPAGGNKAGPKIPTFTPEQARRAPKGTVYRTTDGRTLKR